MPGSEDTRDNGADGPAGRRPWRVEGERAGPPPAPGPSGGRSARRQPSFWALLAGLFLLNWLVSSWFLAPGGDT